MGLWASCIGTQDPQGGLVIRRRLTHTQMDVYWPPDSESRVDYELLFLAFGCFVHKNTRLSGGTGNGIDPVTHYTS